MDEKQEFEMGLPNGVGEQMLAHTIEKFDVKLEHTEFGPKLIGTYEELEKEGLIRSVAGKGFYVCEYNKDYLKEKQLMMIEKRTQEIIYEAKNAGLSCDDLVDMIRTLYEEK